MFLALCQLYVAVRRVWTANDGIALVAVTVGPCLLALAYVIWATFFMPFDRLNLGGL